MEHLEDVPLLEAAATVLGLDYVFSLLGLQVWNFYFCALAPFYSQGFLTEQETRDQDQEVGENDEGLGEE